MVLPSIQYLIEEAQRNTFPREYSIENIMRCLNYQPNRIDVEKVNIFLEIIENLHNIRIRHNISRQDPEQY